MRYSEIKKDLFTVDKTWHLAHCIASDLKMSAGIAVQFQKKFNLRGKIQKSGKKKKHPTCILTGRVFNLITKKKSSSKPTIYSVEKAIDQMAYIALKNGITKIAMPKIACGLDGLSWVLVRKIIGCAFMDTNIHIIVCKKGKVRWLKKKKK